MAEASSLDCPVCGEDFNSPKLLECNHVVCHKCVVDWLRKAGKSGGCPLCRAPILPPFPSHQDDLDTLVDALPTELTIVAKVESNQILSSGHICMICDSHLAATSFCLQCSLKLCKACANAHTKFPTMKNHVVEKLSKLTPERLTKVNRSICKSHDDRLAEVYCSDHQELICMLCAKSNHRLCTEVKAIKEAATEKREEFRQKALRLREKETAMRTQIRQLKDKIAAMRSEANDIFDDLQWCVERRRQEVNDLIQAEEEKMGLAQLDRDRATNMSQASVLDNLVESAPDDALLDMGSAMSSRLDDLERQTGRTDRMEDLSDVIFDSWKLTQLKSDISTVGHLGQQTHGYAAPSAPPPEKSSGARYATPSAPPAEKSFEATPTWPPVGPATGSSSKPRRAELARQLKVGDRVKRGPDWTVVRGNQDKGGWGTVTAIPSQLRSSQGGNPTGCVDVQWDGGGEYFYLMGLYGHYDLDLV